MPAMRAASSLPAPSVAALATLWSGFLLGLSFVATPAKFQASTLTLPVALDVGRATFHLSTGIELIAAAALLCVSVRAHGLASRTFGIAAFVAALLLVQRLLLLPALDARVVQVIAGMAPPPSWHHGAWIALDLLRLVALLLLSIAGARRARRDARMRQGACKHRHGEQAA